MRTHSKDLAASTVATDLRHPRPMSTASGAAERGHSTATWRRRLAGVHLVFLSGLLALSAHAQVTVTEFMASNGKTLADQDGDYSDWIELYNADTNAVNLDGWYLTDSASQLTKWRFPGTNLAPQRFLVVFASGKNRATPGAQLHTSFSLNAGGEYLALVKPDGVTIASEFAPEFPEQFKDISYGAVPGTNAYYYFTKPTPGASNAVGYIAFVADTKFSHDRGFYTTNFDLAITTETTNAAIRYTTNGTPPTAATGILYAGPIPINRTTVIRATAFKTGFLPSNVDSHTYLFLGDVIRQSSDGRAPPGWPTSWGANVVDYGMDPDVVTNSRYSGTIKADLQTIPSYCLVMDLKDLFDPVKGIYANAVNDGPAWERPASIELIYPDSRKGFQVNAGVRIRGGYSRSSGNPKHAFRFFFRSDYGPSRLHYPVFGPDAAQSFDGYDLRTFENYSWSFEGDSRGIFLRDQFSRDAQLAMGQPAERGDFYHLYIDGQYWGLYNTDERPEAAYAASYFGGNKEDYDTIKVNPAAGYSIFATDGNMIAWNKLWTLAKAGFASDAAYQRIQGNNPDGTRNSTYDNLLDVDNLIDYMLVILYGGNLDAPISNFLSNQSPNNFFAVRNRIGNDGFRFFTHDSEHTLLDVNQDRTGPYTAGSILNKSNPQWFWQQLSANAEFRMRVADRVQRHFFNGGLLTPQACTARFLRRKAEIDRAVVGESARWGDAKRSVPLTRDVEWIAEINRVVNRYIPQRTGIVLNQLRNKNLYPKVAAPAFNQFGGNITNGFFLTLSAPAGTIYYTLDGVDPRLPGGTNAPAALVYTVPIALSESVLVKSRVWSGTNWSALTEATFTPIQTFTDVLITEIMYRPPDEVLVDGDQLEFVELKNVGTSERDLSGAHFTNGINYTFPLGARVSPGQFLVLVSDPGAFTNKYPDVQVDGVYTGRLANGGDTLTLVHAAGATVASVTYGTEAPWPISADGAGFSLVPVNPNLNPDPNDPINWRASSRVGGSPGVDDPPINLRPVWINEVLTHTDLPQLDSIELFNPNTNGVDIGNWFLTDRRLAPKKFRVPPGTTIPAGGYVVFTEHDFNPNPGVEPSFALDSHGDEVYLYSADASGNLTGFSDGFSFGAAQNGVTFGRYTNSVGAIQYPTQRANTLAAPNSGPRVGPVVINEIQYHPAPSDDEFVELKNITSSPVKLYDPAYPTNTWRLEGIGFAFPTNVEIAANGLLLVVGVDPARFRARYDVPPSVPVFGAYSGVLQDNGELLQLKRPDTPEVDTHGVVFVPYIVVDEVRYDNNLPWPTNAGGAGPSLERIKATAYGNDPINWRASFGIASPGFENSGNRIPLVSAGDDQTLQAQTFPFPVALSGAASDDGLPNPPGILTVSWSQVSGPGPALFSDLHQLNATASFPGVGTYVLRLTADDGEWTATDDLTVVIARPPAQVTFVPAGSVWKYLDNGSDQGTAWRTNAFEDSSWAAGKAQLGYGDGDEATVVGYGPDANNKYITTYFRRAFMVTNAAAAQQLTVNLLRDDGGVVYLNGVEIFRSNMPAGVIVYNTFADVVVSGADETTTFFENSVDPALLKEGTNVLAVEIHQQNVASSDISFDLDLSGLAAPPNQPPIVDAGADQSVTLPQPAFLRGTAVDDGLPMPPGVVSTAWTLVSGPGVVTFGNSNAVSTTAEFSTPGIYTLRLTASDGALTVTDDVAINVGGETFGQWKARYFTSTELADASVSGDNADPDADGFSNYQEYVSGTDPRDVRSRLQVDSTAWVGGPGSGAQIRFTAVAGRSYTVQYRDSLSGGAWLKLHDVEPPLTTQAVEVVDSAGDHPATRYYRLITPSQP